MISRNNWTKAGRMFCKRLCNKLVRFSRLPQGRHASASNAGPEWALRSLILQHCPKIGTQRSHHAQSHVGGFPCCLLLFWFQETKKQAKHNGYRIFNDKVEQLMGWNMQRNSSDSEYSLVDYQTRIIFRLTICYLYFLYLFHSRQSVLIKVFLII